MKVFEITGVTPTDNLHAQLFATADKLRGSVDASEFKNIVLGLIFLRYISERFEAVQAELRLDPLADLEDEEEYRSRNVFWVPKEARWKYILSQSRTPAIGAVIDSGLNALEKSNESLRGALNAEYARSRISTILIADLLEMISDIRPPADLPESDFLGKIYEYFLGSFAGAEGKRGGEFYTPQSVVELIVSMLHPHTGRIYDPCCGSGGMFVSSERFVRSHGGNLGDIAIYGQELNHTTYRLARMNLAIRGLDAEILWNSDGTLQKDAFPNLLADFILANPPFNISDWGAKRLAEDKRWRYGLPPATNANFAWLQHILYHLAPGGTAGIVLANGSLTSSNTAESEIRKRLVEDGVIQCIVSLPSQLFYSTQIPAAIWILKNHLPAQGKQLPPGPVLMIDLRNAGFLIDRTRRVLSPEDIQNAADAISLWRKAPDKFSDMSEMQGFSKSVSVQAIREKDYTLAPGLYISGSDDGNAAHWRDRLDQLSSDLPSAIDQAMSDLLALKALLANTE